jgi:hypothetical protein
MPTIDLGNGQTIDRGRVPAHMLRAFDQANDALASALSAIRGWVKPFTVMQAPAAFSGAIHCSASSQSGYLYQLGEAGGALAVDQRDAAVFTSTKVGFTVVPSGPTTARPTTGLRVGLVFQDTTLGAYVRYDGAAWNPVTLT